MKTSVLNKGLNWSIKLIIGLLLLWVLYRQIMSDNNLEDMKTIFFTQLKADNLYWFIIAIVFIPINWSLETKKWLVLMNRIENIPFFKAYKAVLIGVTLSIFTPNRVGEYGGRILLVKRVNRTKTIVATLVASFGQLVVLLSMGLVGLIAFLILNEQLDIYLINGLILLSFIGIGLMLFCYLNIDLIIPIVKRIRIPEWIKKYLRPVKILAEYEHKELLKVLWYAFLKYSVYSFQYYCMIRFFGIEIGILIGMMCIALIFLLQTSIPLPPVFDLVIRGNIAISIWGFYTQNEIGILASTFSLWALNIIIPALLGLLFLWNINVLDAIKIKNKKS